MSDFSTHEVNVKVKMRVSAYDKEHAVEVARELLLKEVGVLFVGEYKPLAHTLSDGILASIKGASYKEGMRDALTYLAELYEGIEETDLWADYMKEENK